MAVEGTKSKSAKSDLGRKGLGSGRLRRLACSVPYFGAGRSFGLTEVRGPNVRASEREDKAQVGGLVEQGKIDRKVTWYSNCRN
jgi:hypothetical protein